MQKERRGWMSVRLRWRFELSCALSLVHQAAVLSRSMECWGGAKQLQHEYWMRSPAFLLFMHHCGYNSAGRCSSAIRACQPLWNPAPSRHLSYFIRLKRHSYIFVLSWLPISAQSVPLNAEIMVDCMVTNCVRFVIISEFARGACDRWCFWVFSRSEFHLVGRYLFASDFTG